MVVATRAALRIGVVRVKIQKANPSKVKGDASRERIVNVINGSAVFPKCGLRTTKAMAKIIAGNNAKPNELPMLLELRIQAGIIFIPNV